MTRIIIFTGKGGVGKSSVAAAHALSSAKSGKKTLLVSADTAHNLGDIFKIQIGSKITKISKNLDALELDSDIVKREIFPEVKNTMLNLMGKNFSIYHARSSGSFKRARVSPVGAQSTKICSYWLLS